MQSRPISEPSVPCTSRPVGAKPVVKASWHWARSPEEKRSVTMAPSSTPGTPSPPSWTIAAASTGPSASTKQSVSASCTVMSSTTPAPAA